MYNDRGNITSKQVYMLKMEYFNFRLLLGELRSKQVSGRWWHDSVYSVNVRGSFKLSIGQGTVLPPGAVMPQVTHVWVHRPGGALPRMTNFATF